MQRPEGYSAEYLDLDHQARRLLIDAENLRPPSGHASQFVPETFMQEIKRAGPALPEGAALEPYLWRAVMRAILLGDKMFFAEDLNSIMRGLKLPISFNVWKGGRRDLCKLSQEAMEDPSNYRLPQHFNQEDWSRFQGLIQEAYGRWDFNLATILETKFPRNLVNAGCSTVIARVHGKLVAMGQTIQDYPHEPIISGIGGMYAEGKYRWRYGFGDLINRLLVRHAEVPRSYFSRCAYTPKLTGFVSTVSRATERHFKHGGVVGQGIGVLREGDLASRPVIFLDVARWEVPPVMQSDKAPTREWIEKTVGKSHQVGDLHFYRVQTDPSNNADYIALLKEQFCAGQIMTDFFYTGQWEAIVAFEPRSSSWQREPVGAEQLTGYSSTF